MAKYVVEVYELHCSLVEVEAKSIFEAVDKVSAGEGVNRDDSTEYIEVADRYHGIQDGLLLPAGIRSVELDPDDDGDDDGGIIDIDLDDEEE
jgi:hypothetical protein